MIAAMEHPHHSPPGLAHANYLYEYPGRTGTVDGFPHA